MVATVASSVDVSEQLKLCSVFSILKTKMWRLWYMFSFKTQATPA